MCHIKSIRNKINTESTAPLTLIDGVFIVLLSTFSVFKHQVTSSAKQRILPQEVSFTEKAPSFCINDVHAPFLTFAITKFDC
jgi:hypothetical protein